MDLKDPFSTPSSNERPSPTSHIPVVPKHNLLFLPALQWLSPGQFETNKKVKYNIFKMCPDLIWFCCSFFGLQKTKGKLMAPQDWSKSSMDPSTLTWSTPLHFHPHSRAMPLFFGWFHHFIFYSLKWGKNVKFTFCPTSKKCEDGNCFCINWIKDDSASSFKPHKSRQAPVR